MLRDMIYPQRMCRHLHLGFSPRSDATVNWMDVAVDNISNTIIIDSQRQAEREREKDHSGLTFEDARNVIGIDLIRSISSSY